jgi:hypothetical protein
MYGISFQKLSTLSVKGGLSANKFLKSQICKLLDLRTSLKCSNLRNCYFRSRCFWRFPELRFPDAVFCGLKLSQIRNYMIKMLRFKFVLKKFKEQARGLILAGFAMKWPTRNQLLTRGCLILCVLFWIICGFEHERNLRICDMRIIHKNCRFVWGLTHPINLRICWKHAHLCKR